MKIFEHRR